MYFQTINRKDIQYVIVPNYLLLFWNFKRWNLCEMSSTLRFVPLKIIKTWKFHGKQLKVLKPYWITRIIPIMMFWSELIFNCCTVPCNCLLLGRLVMLMYTGNIWEEKKFSALSCSRYYQPCTFSLYLLIINLYFFLVLIINLYFFPFLGRSWRNIKWRMWWGFVSPPTR